MRLTTHLHLVPVKNAWRHNPTSLYVFVVWCSETRNFFPLTLVLTELSIMSDYRLDDRGSIPDRGKDFTSSLCVQTSSWIPPSLLNNGYRGSFPGGKVRSGRDADHSPYLVSRSRMSRSYTSSPPSAFMACSETALAFSCMVQFDIVSRTRFEVDASRYKAHTTRCLLYGFWITHGTHIFWGGGDDKIIRYLFP
jgi:hypothetical protein